MFYHERTAGHDCVAAVTASGKGRSFRFRSRTLCVHIAVGRSFPSRKKRVHTSAFFTVVIRPSASVWLGGVGENLTAGSLEASVSDSVAVVLVCRSLGWISGRTSTAEVYVSGLVPGLVLRFLVHALRVQRADANGTFAVQLPLTVVVYDPHWRSGSSFRPSVGRPQSSLPFRATITPPLFTAHSSLPFRATITPALSTARSSLPFRATITPSLFTAHGSLPFELRGIPCRGGEWLNPRKLPPRRSGIP